MLFPYPNYKIRVTCKAAYMSRKAAYMARKAAYMACKAAYMACKAAYMIRLIIMSLCGPILQDEICKIFS